MNSKVAWELQGLQRRVTINKFSEKYHLPARRTSGVVSLAISIKRASTEIVLARGRPTRFKQRIMANWTDQKVVELLLNVGERGKP